MQRIYYVILVDGTPEQVTTIWARAKQAADELTTKNREAKIIPCAEAVPPGVEREEFESEEPTEPGEIWTPLALQE